VFFTVPFRHFGLKWLSLLSGLRGHSECELSL